MKSPENRENNPSFELGHHSQATSATHGSNRGGQPNWFVIAVAGALVSTLVSLGLVAILDAMGPWKWLIAAIGVFLIGLCVCIAVIPVISHGTHQQTPDRWTGFIWLATNGHAIWLKSSCLFPGRIRVSGLRGGRHDLYIRVLHRTHVGAEMVCCHTGARVGDATLVFGDDNCIRLSCHFNNGDWQDVNLYKQETWGGYIRHTLARCRGAPLEIR